MKLLLHMTIFLWITLSIVFGLFTALKEEREDLAYRQIFIWFLSPIIAFAGLVFIDKGRKKYYFIRLKNDLFIKK